MRDPALSREEQHLQPAGVHVASEQAILPNRLDQLLQQATLLARQLQRERAGLQGIGRTDGRPAVKALQQQIVQVWNAIRAARSSSDGN